MGICTAAISNSSMLIRLDLYPAIDECKRIYFLIKLKCFPDPTYLISIIIINHHFIKITLFRIKIQEINNKVPAFLLSESAAR